MPIWALYVASLVSFLIIGATLGWMHKLIKALNLFEGLRPGLQVFTQLLVSVAILFPIWSFLFGFFGSTYGLTPAQAPVWVASIGIGLAIALYAWINETNSSSSRVR